MIAAVPPTSAALSGMCSPAAVADTRRPYPAWESLGPPPGIRPPYCGVGHVPASDQPTGVSNDRLQAVELAANRSRPRTRRTSHADFSPARSLLSLPGSLLRRSGPGVAEPTDPHHRADR